MTPLPQRQPGHQGRDTSPLASRRDHFEGPSQLQRFPLIAWGLLMTTKSSTSLSAHDCVLSPHGCWSRGPYPVNFPHPSPCPWICFLKSWYEARPIPYIHSRMHFGPTHTLYIGPKVYINQYILKFGAGEAWGKNQKHLWVQVNLGNA